MNIVYLIGNGFDLNLGMKTRYRDFCEYYKRLPTDNDEEIVKKIKKEMWDNIEVWSEFESTLGEYTKNIVKSQEAVALHEHLIDHLQKYLETEENKYILDKTQEYTLYKYLSYPYSNNRLVPEESNEIDRFASKWQSTHWDVKIITFNYTRSIERLLGRTIDEKINIGSHHTSWKIKLSAIEHIHGFTDQRMILGVNDETQIANTAFHTDTDVVDRYVKSKCNDVYGLGHDKNCQQWIKQANLICLFGLSLGDTDKRWWDAIGEVLQNENKVIIFEYILNPPNMNQGAREKKLKDKLKDTFLSKTNIGEDFKNDIKKNMYVAFNKDMFKFDNLKKRIENDLESV